MQAGDLDFVKNQGQWEDFILFKTDLPGGTLFLEQDRLTFSYFDTEQWEDFHEHFVHGGKKDKNFIVNQHSYQIVFQNSSTSATKGESKKKQYFNYFLGNDPDKWQSRVSAFEEVWYRDIYEGIDLRIYASDSNIKYDFVVHPGADPNQILLEYIGIENLCVKNEELYINTAVNQVTETAPYTFQETKRGKKTVENSYRLEGNLLSFDLGSYNPKNKLVIDPELLIATYSGSFARLWAHTATYGLNGEAFAGGRIFGSNYPNTIGFYQQSFNDNPGFFNDTDMLINKVSPDGTQLLFGTFMGGFNGDVEHPNSLIVNGNNDLVILGFTTADDFPVTGGAYDNTFGGESDLTLSILSEDGTTMLASTFIGGSEKDGENPYTVFYEDSYRSEVIIDESDNSIIVCSTTHSSDFPISSGAFQSNLNGNYNGAPSLE